MAVNLKPLADRVVIEPQEEEVATFAGGQLILPDTAKEKPQRGTVVAVGPGRLDEDGDRIPMEVRVGNTVIYSKYAGTTVKMPDGKEYLIVKESDILAIVE
jgi:chaperonin GroES